MEYQQINDQNGNPLNTCIKKIDDNGIISCVPNDPANIDWLAYQTWLAMGNTPQSAE